MITYDFDSGDRIVRFIYVKISPCRKSYVCSKQTVGRIE